MKLNIEQDYLGIWRVTDENYCGCGECLPVMGIGDTKQEAIKDYKLNLSEAEAN